MFSRQNIRVVYIYYITVYGCKGKHFVEQQNSNNDILIPICPSPTISERYIDVRLLNQMEISDIGYVSFGLLKHTLDAREKLAPCSIGCMMYPSI